MGKKPSEEKIQEYDRTYRFCKLMMLLQQKLGESAGDDRAKIFVHGISDSWRNGNLTFSQAYSGMKMACRDLLEMTQDLSSMEIQLYDQAFKSQKVPTLTEMRVKHWNLVPKILAVPAYVGVDPMKVDKSERKIFRSSSTVISLSITSGSKR